MSDEPSRRVVLTALHQALARRPTREALLHHSDRGSQYASHDYRALLVEEGIACSMSRRGNCWDNAVVESLFGTLKTELAETNWPTRAAASAAVTDYIDVFIDEDVRWLSPRDAERLGYPTQKPEGLLIESSPHPAVPVTWLWTHFAAAERASRSPSS